MIVDAIFKNEAALSQIARSLSGLHTAHVFAALLEIGALRSKPRANDKPIEYAALRASWHEGYVEAIEDLFHFLDRFKPEQTAKMRASFNAAEKLLQQGDISKDEYAKYTGKPAPSK